MGHQNHLCLSPLIMVLLLILTLRPLTCALVRVRLERGWASLCLGMGNALSSLGHCSEKSWCKTEDIKGTECALSSYPSSSSSVDWFDSLVHPSAPLQRSAPVFSPATPHFRKLASNTSVPSSPGLVDFWSAGYVYIQFFIRGKTMPD